MSKESPDAESLFAENQRLRMALETALRDSAAREKAAQETQRSLTLLDTLLDTAPTGFCFLDRELRFIRINERLAEMNGLPARAHIGRSVAEVVPALAKAAGDVARRIVATGEAVRNHEFCGETAAAPGLTRFYNESWYPVREPAGLIVGFGVIVEDITERKRSEEALRESEARFRSTFHNAATPMSITHADGRFLAVNRAYCQMLGYAEAELLATNFGTVTHPEDRHATATEAVRQLMTGEIKAFRTEKRYLHKSGDIVWGDLSVSVVPNSDGSVANFIAQVHDITASKKAAAALRESEHLAHNQWAQAEAVLEALPANIALLDSAGVILRINKAWAAFAEKNAGFSSAGPGSNYLTVCDVATGPDAEPAGRFAAGIRAVIGGQCERFSMEYPCHAPRETRWFIGYVTQALGAGTAHAVVAHVDITAQKIIEAQIRLLNSELEVRVLKRTEGLNSASEALVAQMAERRRLEREILEISEREQLRLGQDLHDGLGQELAGIALLGKALSDKLAADAHPLSVDAARIALYTKDTIGSARRLAKGLYPIELGRAGLLVALEDLANQTSQRLNIVCELRHSGPVPVLSASAEIHLYRIVQECIGNAIKHGQASRILIEAACRQDSLLITVSDDGPGISKQAGCAGIGLHLMEYRARVIGARMTFENAPTGGCRVSFELPGDRNDE